MRQRITALRQRGIKVGTCVPVLCEIEAGIQQVTQPDVYRLNLERLLRQIRVWPIDPSTATIYGAIHHDLRRRGRVLSQVDMMAAALARQMALTVVTSDRDFAALPDIADRGQPLTKPRWGLDPAIMTPDPLGCLPPGAGAWGSPTGPLSWVVEGRRLSVYNSWR